MGARRAARAERARAARETRLATAIRQFDRDTEMLDDAVAGWLGVSRADLGNDGLRHEEMARPGQLVREQPTPARAAAAPGQAAAAKLPAGADGLLQRLFGGPAAAGPPGRYSAADTDALTRFFAAAHERRMARIQRIRATMADGRPGAA